MAAISQQKATMVAPPFLTFASVLQVETEEACFAQSLTHAQCGQLINSIQAVATRCANERAGRGVRLRRLWQFYKVLCENELASQACYVHFVQAYRRYPEGHRCSVTLIVGGALGPRECPVTRHRLRLTINSPYIKYIDRAQYKVSPPH